MDGHFNLSTAKYLFARVFDRIARVWNQSNILLLFVFLIRRYRIHDDEEEEEEEDEEPSRIGPGQDERSRQRTYPDISNITLTEASGGPSGGSGSGGSDGDVGGNKWETVHVVPNDTISITLGNLNVDTRYEFLILSRLMSGESLFSETVLAKTDQSEWKCILLL